MAADDRQARLAAALRANLKRRKAPTTPASPTAVAEPTPPVEEEPKAR